MSVVGPGTRFSRSLAFVVGIDTYSGGIPPLRSAVADAAAIAEVLRRDHGFETRCLFDRAAGLSELLAVLRDELPDQLGLDDRLLFYFAGHGVALDGDGGPAGYLLPATARRADRDSFLAMHVLHGELAKLAVRHALVILDCCFAGTFRWSSLRDIEAEPRKVYRERYDRYVESAAWQVLTSASSEQRALDVLASDRGEGESRHSPFARALLDGLAGGADYTGDNLITASELAMFVRERVEPSAEAAGRYQTPQLFALDRHDHGEYVFQVPGRSLELAPAPVLTEASNPYRGLCSFAEADSGQFFGRAAVARDLVEAILAKPLTVVVGPSGCGKSSVVHAGAVPALRAKGWTVLSTQRPAGSPIAGLAALACELHGGSLALDGDPVAAWCAAVTRRASDHPDQPWLVVLDQFEELITQRAAHDQARTEQVVFLDALAFALRAAPSLHLVVTVRSDVEPQFRDSSLGAWWTAARIAIPGMTRDELREVIERPATSFVLYFEPSRLVDRLIDDVALAAAPLPLLSFALSELYRRCWSRWRDGSRDRALLASDYDAMGSVASALTQRATALHDDLLRRSPAYANTVRNVFTRMVAFVDGDRARRRVPRDELVYDDEDENRRVAEVLDRFHEARLVSLGSELGEAGQIVSYAEPTHDELVRGWAKVTDWLDELERPIGTRAVVHAVGAAASAWIASRRAVSYLWIDPRVELAHAIERGRPLLFNAAEAAFVARSLHRRRSRRRRFVFSLIAVAVGLSGATGVTLWQRNVATRNATENERMLAQSYQETGRQLLIAADPLQALPYIVAARDAARDADEAGTPLRMMFHAATRALPLATLEHDSAVSLAVFSPDGRRIATAGDDHTAQVWDVATGASLPCPLRHDDKVTSVAFSPDGARLLTASEDGTAQIWDAATGKPLTPALRHRSSVVSAAFSRDGSRVVTASWDDTARIWDATTGAPLGHPLEHPGVVWSAAFSPDGTRIATADEDNTARIWDAANGALLTAGLAHHNAVSSVEFSPDGARVVTASTDHTARIWDVATGELVGELTHTQAVASAEFSPDGTRVVTASADGTARIWNAATGERVGELTHKGAVVSAAFSPDGTRIVTASVDRSARIWDAATGKPLADPLEHGGPVRSAVFSRDGAHVATASADRGARIWDATTSENFFYRLDRAGAVNAAFSPDGRHVVTTGTDRTVRVWCVATGRELFPALPHQVSDVAAVFSTDGGRIASAGEDDTVQVRDVTTGEPRAPAMRHPGAVEALAFSPDGARILTTSKDGTARVWDAVTGTLLTPVPIEQGGRAVFSRDGTRIAATLGSHAARVWDATTGRPLSPPLLHHDTIVSVGFNPDGTRVITASSDHTACVWDATTGRLVIGALLHGDSLASAEFNHDGTRIVTAADDQTARIWEAATGRPLAVLTHQGGLYSAKFNRDDTRVLTVALDHTVRLWDATIGALVGPPLEHPEPTLAAALSPDGARIATTSRDRRARVWDAVTGKLLAAPFEHPRPVLSVAFSSDGRYLLTTSEDGARLWDVTADPGTPAAWHASAERGPYVLAGGVVAPRASGTPALLRTAQPSGAGPAPASGSCPPRAAGQTASARR